jgi:hypothetical protein
MSWNFNTILSKTILNVNSYKILASIGGIVGFSYGSNKYLYDYNKKYYTHDKYKYYNDETEEKFDKLYNSVYYFTIGGFEWACYGIAAGMLYPLTINFVISAIIINKLSNKEIEKKNNNKIEFDKFANENQICIKFDFDKLVDEFENEKE